MIGLNLSPFGGKRSFGTSSPSLPLFLDTVDAYSAHSIVKKLRTAYSGNCLTIRRSSDNTEQSFGFVANQLDQSSILAFCGAGNGFIAKVYNQTAVGSSLDYVQTTWLQQPQLVVSGAINTLNGKPEALCNGTSTLTIPTSTALFNFMHNGADATIFSTSRYGNVANPLDWYGLYGNNSTTGAEVCSTAWYDDLSRSDALVVQITPGSFVAYSLSQNVITPNQQTIITIFLDANNATYANRTESYINGGAALKPNTYTAVASVSDASQNMMWGGVGTTSYGRLVGGIQEKIIFDSNKLSLKSSYLALW